MQNSNVDRPISRNDGEPIAMSAQNEAGAPDGSMLETLALLARRVSSLQAGADRLREEADKLDDEACKARDEIIETVLSLHRCKGGKGGGS